MNGNGLFFLRIGARTHAAVTANSPKSWKRVGDVHTGRLVTRLRRVALHIRLSRQHSALIILPVSEIRGSEMMIDLNDLFEELPSKEEFIAYNE
ncbi:hypothetical protein AVEN_184982-1 [Araneus ventricosus]|uniref:Uncharacterized protein n=1 Tax=Araneus ventricosus TaxID=182803 RepID=A0A4Y2N4W0_ARAVE|nr:hypothetical protein AVEN_184982-1 [Araneus ventricosus]